MKESILVSGRVAILAAVFRILRNTHRRTGIRQDARFGSQDGYPTRDHIVRVV